MMVTGTSFPFKPRVSAVSCRIKLMCAPESSRTFSHLKRPFALTIFVERTGRIAFFVLVALATPILMALSCEVAGDGCVDTASRSLIFYTVGLDYNHPFCGPFQPFQTAETHMVSFGGLDAFIDAEGCKFLTLVGPV